MYKNLDEAGVVPLGRRPVIYEINTWVWLHELSRKYERKIDLGTVPEEEWKLLAVPAIDAVWLMGAWERSPAGIEVVNRDESLQQEFRQTLPDYEIQDNVGSPYCVRCYQVDDHLGGPEGLAAARRALASCGLSLVLDFVPNHVAIDHSWVKEHPEYFIHGTEVDLSHSPRAFFKAGASIIANGKDPYFPAWSDVAQLNPFNHDLRRVMAETINDIASRCDAIRCDMAMLLLNDIVQRTWGERAGQRPETEYWTDVITAVRAEHPRFRFIAEVYWDLEWTLQQLGFDFCYDKRLYDRLVHENAGSIRLHLLADDSYQEKLVRFIENHDEPRAGVTFESGKARAVAVVCCTLPGALLLHEGQLEGRHVRLPVFLTRRPEEPVNGPLRSFYLRLLEALKSTGVKKGNWKLCERHGWRYNLSYFNIIAWCWQYRENRLLIAVNFSSWGSQALIQVPWLNSGNSSWKLTDLIKGTVYGHSHGDLYVDLPPWESHVLTFELTIVPAGA